MISVALTASAYLVAGGDSAGPPGKPVGAADSPPAQSPSAPGDAFLALLVAGLGIETAIGISDAAGQPQTGAGRADGPRAMPAKTAAPARGKSKDQINELACVAPPVTPETPMPVATCLPEMPADPGPSKTSDKQAPETPSTDGSCGPRNTGPSPTRPIAVDGRGASVENTTDSGAPRSQIAFEALVRAPNVENAGNYEPAADSVTSVAASSVAPAILQPAAPESASTASPAPVAPEPAINKESGNASDRPPTLPSDPGPVTKPPESEGASPNGEQQQDLPDKQKQSSEGAGGVSRAETPPILSALVTSAAEPAPPPAPKLQSAGDATPVRAAADVAATGAVVSPARDILLQLPNPGGPRVDVQLTDRAGTVHIVVRTEDSDLTRDLRSNLPELTQKLSQQGMEAEAWSPAEMHGAAAGQENPGHSREQSEGWAGSGGSQHGAGGNPHGGRRQFPGESADEESGENFSNAFTGAASWQPVR